MSTPQQASHNPHGRKPGVQYTESDYRGAAASIDLAAEIIMRGKVPKEREQWTLLDRSYHSSSAFMKGYRAVLQQAFEKPDSFFDPLLPFLQDAMDAMPISIVGHRDLYAGMVGQEAAQEQAEEGVREGRIQRLYEMRQDVEGWVRSTVAEILETLGKHAFFDAVTGRQLVHATVCLRFVYGEILAGLNQYVASSERLAHEHVCAFAATAIGNIRAAMMLETFRHFEEEPKLDSAISDFMTLGLAVGGNRLQLGALSARSQFEVVRKKLLHFEEKRSQIASSMVDYCAWPLFAESGLPHVEEFARGHAGSASRSTFFVPGQIVFVELPEGVADSVIYGAFDTHSGTRSVAASCDPAPNGVDLGFQLSGSGLSPRLAVGAEHAAGMRIDDRGKAFPSWSHRLAPLPNPELGERVAASLRKALEVQEIQISELWREVPDLLGILSESEATVVIFDGGRAVVLGTCLPGSEARQAFFSAGESVPAVEYAARAKLELAEPALWFARVVRTVEVPAAPSIEENISAEQVREQDRRAFRDAVSRTGAMNYRTFVASLSTWDVVETTDGRGGHGSLKRVLKGSELRAGTWGKLRDPERNMNFARMYEILDSLRVPVDEYTRWLLGTL